MRVTSTVVLNTGQHRAVTCEGKVCKEWEDNLQKGWQICQDRDTKLSNPCHHFNAWYLSLNKQLLVSPYNNVNIPVHFYKLPYITSGTNFHRNKESFFNSALTKENVLSKGSVRILQAMVRIFSSSFSIAAIQKNWGGMRKNEFPNCNTDMEVSVTYIYLFILRNTSTIRWNGDVSLNLESQGR